MRRINLVALYALFCLLSMAANVLTQAIASWAYHGPYALFLTMFLGTGLGLVTKYLLDRKWIFAHTSRNTVHEARTAAMYTVMGAATTVIFWTTEWSFDHLFGEFYRYLGAVTGLIIGYTVKYFLDRRFVFV